LQWGNAIGEPYTGNPYVRFDEGTEVERPPPTLRGWGFLLASFNNQAGTNSAIFSMLTGLIPLHFDDCLPFSMFAIADISKINSADFNKTLEKFDQKCFV
jgi:hypothetical protein